MEPSRFIPLSQEHLAMLGELTAILGLVDDEMVKLAEFLLKVDRKAANTIMGSTSVATNATIWAETIRTRSANEDALWLVKHAQEEVQAVSAGRNDFVHAAFETQTINFGGSFGSSAFGMETFGGGSYTVSTGVALARRVKTGKKTSLEKLPILRDRAARLSCLICHISHIVCGSDPETSSWHERLAPTLPQRPETPKARKAKAP